jgi:hypothetical protein
MVQAWTIGGKYKKKNESLGPGPGQYSSRNHGVNKNQAPNWTIGTSQRNSFKSRALSPGPGMYNTVTDGNKAPKYHFGTKSVTDLDKFKKSVPGPGQYDPSSNTFGNVAFSFNGRNDLKNKENMGKPGPGTYGLKSTLGKTMGKIGTSQKGNSLVSKLILDNPGPGQYAPGGSDIYKAAAPRYGFGSSKRGNDGSKSKGLLPGPGHYGYAPKIGNQAPKYSLTSRRPDTTPSPGKYSPGPGNYNPSDDFARTQNPQYKFGSSSRKDLKRDAGPAPGTYTSNALDSRKKSSPSFGFGSGKRAPLSQTTNSPGPGNYNMPSKIIEKNGYYMGIKTNVRKRDESPGPGNYNPDVNLRKHKSPTHVIGSSPRGQIKRDMVPGPGNYKYYNPNLDKGPHVKIGTEKRGYQVKSDTPGPGDYKIPVKIFDVPRYLIPNPDERYKFV